MIRALMIFSGLAAALPALAAAQTPAAPNRLDPDAMICKTLVITGSRLGARKICQTRAQWEAMSRHDRRDLEDGLQRAFSANCTITMSGGTGRCS